MSYAITVVIALIVDQALKYWINTHIVLNTGELPLIPGFLHLANVHNSGAAFSVLQGARWFFVGLCVVFIAAVIVLMALRIINGKLARWAAILVLAGALGNCLDRVIAGFVVDMFEFDFLIAGRRFPVFNVADILITVGAILFCLSVLFEKNALGGGKKNRAQPEAVNQAPPSRPEPAAHPAPPVRASAPLPPGAVKAVPGKATDPAPSKSAEAKAKPASSPQDKPKLTEKAKPETGSQPAAKAIPAAPEPEPEVDPGDPFSVWERHDRFKEAAKEKEAAAQEQARMQENSPAIRRSKTEYVMQTLVSGRPQETAAAPKADTAAAPKPEPVPEHAPVTVTAPQPAPQPKPEKPGKAPAAAAEEESFSLEDILAEFRDI